jgi:hypothetical protein
MSQEENVDPRLVEQLTRLRAAFIARFGREPQADEPLVFDPASDVPVPFRHANVKPEVHAAMVAAAVPAHILYAYERTGLLLSKEAAAKTAPDKLDAYRVAMDEFAALQYRKRLNNR